MRNLFRQSLSPSMVVALLALVVSLGGVSYAAVSVANNSVGSAQVRNHSLKSVDLKTEVTAAQRALGSGQTMRGTFLAAGNNGFIGTGITFPQRLPNNFNKQHVRYITGGPTAKCPGAGQAARGWACFYEEQNSSASLAYIYDEDYDSPDAVGTFGTRIYWTVSSAGYADGVWAIRAP